MALSGIRNNTAGLSDGVKVEVYEAVIEYGISGKRPELKRQATVAFNGIKSVMDSAETYARVALWQKSKCQFCHKNLKANRLFATKSPRARYM